MQKVRVVLDEQKFRREKKYSSAKISAYLDTVFLDTCQLAKDNEGYYVSTDDDGDLMRFGQANYILSNQPWFLDNVKSWLFFSNDDTDTPDEFIVEDVKDYYIKRRGRMEGKLDCTEAHVFGGVQ